MIMKQPLNLVLMGPPGAGKSTIAEALTEQFPLVVVSTGQWLRDAIRHRNAVGRAAVPYLNSGNLVPDSLMDRVLREILETLNPDQGLLLDGYPRTVVQAIGLLGALADFDRTLDVVLALDVSDEIVIRRLSGRRMCETANGQFPVHIDDLASMMRCRERGGRPVQREDDAPAVVAQRLAVYQEQTRPLLDYYTEHGLLLRVDAGGSPAEVSRQALAMLKTVA
jgi:adenylate kinase